MTIFQEDVVTTVPRLRAFARSLANGDRQLADDLVQDTVVNALRARGSSRRARTSRLGCSRSCATASAAWSDGGATAAAAGRRGAGAGVWTPPAQDAVIDRSRSGAPSATCAQPPRGAGAVGVHGLRYERVAEVCGCQIGTVKSRINRARTVLKAKLLGEDAAARPASRRARKGVGGVSRPRRRARRPPARRRCRAAGARACRGRRRSTRRPPPRGPRGRRPRPTPAGSG